jgi:hypothetical protein
LQNYFYRLLSWCWQLLCIQLQGSCIEMAVVMLLWLLVTSHRRHAAKK